MATTRRRPRRGFGKVRRLPSGRFQASYAGPDLARHTAPVTFEAKIDAEHWLAVEHRLIESGQWEAPKRRALALRGVMTLREYAPGAIDRRRVRGEPLRPRTRALYASQLERLVFPTFGDKPLRSITRDDVTRWYDSLGPSHPTQRAHAYSLLRAILGQAVTEGLVATSPCQIPGAGRSTRQRRIEPASLPELAAIVEGMPERLRLLVLLGAWCALRYGELAELRRRDVDLRRGVLSISRAVVRVDGADLVGRPKSVAGLRDVAIPPHLIPVIQAHLDEHVAAGPDALLFPRPRTNHHLVHTEVTKIFMTARAAAGRPDLRLHDLRHTGAVLAAQTGATLAELMARLGHSTPGAALRYQHAAAGRDAQIAARLSELARG